MAGKNLTQRIKSMEQKKNQVENQLAALRAKAKTDERKKDTRRKILVGSYFLKKYNDSGKMNELVDLMNAYLGDHRDRELFGLYDNYI